MLQMITLGWFRSRRIKVFQIAFVPFIPVEVIVKLRLLFLPDIEGFIHYDETHLVRQFQQLGRRWIVRGSNAIDTHRLQHLELALKAARVYGGAECTQVVVITNAANLYRLAVKEETFLDVEVEIANAKGVS